METGARKPMKFNEFRSEGSTSLGHFQDGLQGLQATGNFSKKKLAFAVVTL